VMKLNRPPGGGCGARRLAGYPALIIAMAAAACGPQAADAPVPQPMELPGVSGALLYMPGQFAYFAPKTALDMLERVPDFTIRPGEDGMGNVLVDGEPVDGAAGSVREHLAAIPADNVLRIEVIDASAHGIPGVTGSLANIVTQPDNFLDQSKA